MDKQLIDPKTVLHSFNCHGLFCQGNNTKDGT